MMDVACWALASWRMSDLVASPCTVTNPALLACSSAVAFSSTTTMSAGATSAPTLAATTARPLVPYPMTTSGYARASAIAWIFSCADRGQRFHRGTDQDEQECHSQRRHHNDID